MATNPKWLAVYCGNIGQQTFNLKVDDAVREELDGQYVRPSGSKIKPKLWDLGPYWLEGHELAQYECELADRRAVSSGRGLLELFRKAADLPQQKPWLDASEVIKCEEMPNF